MSYKIEKNIEMPSKISSRKGTTKYPFAEMEIGDSFIIDPSLKSKTQLSSTANDWAKRNGLTKRFSVRAISNGDYRLWRIE